MTQTFNHLHHRFGESRYFEDFNMGESFYIPSRTLGEANFAAFQLASGDNHPIHYDKPYCQERGHPERLAHGFQVAIQTAPGAGLFPHLLGDGLIAFIEQSSRFLKPVYCGDTVYPRLEIAALEPGRRTGVVVLRSTVHNERDELVMEGEQRMLVKKRHPVD